MIKKFFNLIDKIIDNFLIKNVNNMPIRFTKFIAYYYMNAIVRKVYLRRLGIIMEEGTFSNLGLSFTPNEDYSPCVIIGKNVSIAPNVTFITNSMPNNSKLLLENYYVKNKLIKTRSTIIVEDDAWLGTGCIIMPGVKIKKGSIIGACALVLEDTEDFSIYAGIPAKKIRNI